MKKTFIFLLMIGAVYLSQAQFVPMTPELFYNTKVPAAPAADTICNSSAAQKQEFSEKMVKLQKAVEEQIAYLKKDEKKNAATLEQQAKQNVATQYGLSATDMQKMQSGKMTKEEKKAMADKMMQQQNLNITVDEAREVSKMDKENKKTWAEGYTNQQKAAAGPAKNQGQQANAMSLVELTKEKDVLSKKLAVRYDQFEQRLSALKTDTTGIRLLGEIDKLSDKYSGMVGVDYGQGPEMDKIAATIKMKKLQYCTMLTKIHVGILGEYKASISGDFEDFYRLETLINEVNKQSTGADVNLMAKGLISYEHIKSYIQRLKEVYRYSIYNTGNPY